MYLLSDHDKYSLVTAQSGLTVDGAARMSGHWTPCAAMHLRTNLVVAQVIWLRN
jgi:hypothetical protein